VIAFLPVDKMYTTNCKIATILQFAILHMSNYCMQRNVGIRGLLCCKVHHRPLMQMTLCLTDTFIKVVYYQPSLSKQKLSASLMSSERLSAIAKINN